MYRCVICCRVWRVLPVGARELRMVEVGGDLAGVVVLVLCADCAGVWVWSAAGRYYRRREPSRAYVRQYGLYRSICDLAGEFGYSASCVYTEVGFVDWCIGAMGYPLLFDIAIPSRCLVIEYNGEQHYHYVEGLHKSYEDFLRQRQNDGIKLRSVRDIGWSCLVFSYQEDVFNLDWVHHRLSRVFGR